METEIQLLREIEKHLRNSLDTLLKDIVPENCNCSKNPVKKVFRCPDAFHIAMQLEKLENLKRD